MEVITTRPTNVTQVPEAELKDHVGKIVLSTVEETLNAMLDADADSMTGAAKYERSPDRQDYRAGHYKRKLHTKGRSALMLCAARLRHVAGTNWEQRRYLDMSWLNEPEGTPAHLSTRASA